ncbi:MAG: molybdopterin-dependent oxidoreductase, partial [Gaiellaceae bacterium]
EQASALARLVREGLGGNTALLPDVFHPSLDRFRAPLSAIGAAEVCLVLGDEPVIERAPIVDLWLRAARRAGAEVITVNPAGTVSVPPGYAATASDVLLGESPPDDLRTAARALKKASRVALIWSEDDPSGGQHVAALAAGIGGEVAAYLLPRTPNGRGVAAAWRDAGDGVGDRPPAEGEIGALIVSGDEACTDPRVVELAQRARFVLVAAMFQSEVTGWAQLVVPGTSYLERDGTYVNLEGRPQRLRSAVAPPFADELELYAPLAGRFGIAVDPWSSGALPADEAELPQRDEGAPEAAPPRARGGGRGGKGLRLVRYRGLFSGAAVERVPQLQFQRPLTEVELSAADAGELGLASGDHVAVTSNGTSRTLTARLNRRLLQGVVRIPAEHAEGLEERVSLSRVSGGNS